MSSHALTASLTDMSASKVIKIVHGTTEWLSTAATMKTKVDIATFYFNSITTLFLDGYHVHSIFFHSYMDTVLPKKTIIYKGMHFDVH